LAHEYDYENSFIVSAVTNHYWAENKQIIDTMSKIRPDNAWFYNMLSGGKKVSVVIDSNTKRNGQTYVFFNVLIGPVDKPVGVAGVGLSLVDLAKEFQSLKYGADTHLMLIDGTGTVLLSDRVESDRSTIGQQIPQAMADQVLGGFKGGTQVLEYKNGSGVLTDLISYPLQTEGLRIVFTIDRQETIAFLQTIKVQTIVATVVSLVVIILLFFYISRRISNPYKRALQLNEELERQVAQRSRQLAEQHARMRDSIDYAKRIQTSLLPSEELMRQLFPDHFVIWQPVDAVGGDFYWAAETPAGRLAAVGDCTGHGVPGAFMTMLSVTLLNQIVQHEGGDDPGLILARLNVLLKETLKQRDGDALGKELSDDGLDIGLCLVTGNRVRYAGAKCSLYVLGGGADTGLGLGANADEGAGSGSGEVAVVKGNTKSVGYRRTPTDYRFEVKELTIRQGDTLYMTTDGYPDQGGGEKGYSFGWRRFADVIAKGERLPLERQRELFVESMQAYMQVQGAEQRDDWSVLAFRPAPLREETAAGG
jgi:hypothetical protein